MSYFVFGFPDETPRGIYEDFIAKSATDINAMASAHKALTRAKVGTVLVTNDQGRPIRRWRKGHGWDVPGGAQ